MPKDLKLAFLKYTCLCFFFRFLFHFPKNLKSTLIGIEGLFFESRSDFYNLDSFLQTIPLNSHVLFLSHIIKL